jgi:hypothetical protein
MPIDKDKRKYKHEYALQKARNEDKPRHDRYEARKMIDAAGIDRKGKHVAHTRALANGGKTTKENIKVVAPHANLSFPRKSNHKPVK